MDPPPGADGVVLRRLPARAAAGLGLLAGGVLLALLIAFFGLRTDAGNRWLLTRLLPLVQPDRGAIEVGRLETDLVGRLVLTDVRLVDEDGVELARITTATARYSLGGLPGRVLVVERLDLDGLTLSLRHPDGCRDPASLWDAAPPSDTPWAGLGFDVQVRAFSARSPGLDACSGDTPLVTGPTTLEGSASLAGPEARVSALRLESTLLDPAWGELRIEASGAWDGDRAELAVPALSLGPNRVALQGTITELGGEGRLDLRLEAATVDPASFGVTDLRGPLEATGSVSGTLTRPIARVDLHTPGGVVEVDATADLGEARPAWSARVATRRLDLGAVVPAAGVAVLGGTVAVEGAGTSWPDDLLATVELDLSVEALADLGGGSVRGRVVVEDGVAALGGVEVRTEGARLTAGGTVDFVVGRHDLEVVEARVDLARLEGFGAPAMRGELRFQGEVAGSWAGLAGARAAGRFTVTGFELPGAARVGELEGRAEVVLDEEGFPHGAVSADARRLAAGGFEADAATLTLQADGRRLGALVSVVDEARELVGARATYDLGTGELVADALHLAPAAGFDWLADRPVRLRVDPRGVHGLDLALSSAHASLELRGSWVDEVFDLRLEVSRFDLAELGSLPEAGLAGWGGRATGSATLTGTLAEPGLLLDLTAEDVEIPTLVRGADLRLGARVRGRILGFVAELEGGGRPLLRLDGALPLTSAEGLVALDPEGPLDLAVVLPVSSLADWAATLVGLPEAEVAASAELRLTGTLATPQAKLTASARARVGEPAEWLVADLDAESRRGRVHARLVVRERLTPRAQAVGSVGLDLERVARALFAGGPAVDWDHPESLLSELSLDVVPLQLPIEALSPFVDLPAELSGGLVGGLHLSGHPLAPRVEGALMAVDARLGELVVSPAMLTLAASDEGYQVAVDLGFGADGGITVAGFVPMPADAAQDLDAALATPGLDLDVSGPGLPVAAIAPFLDDTTDPAGRIRVEGRVGGSVAAPEPNLRVQAQGAALTHLGLNVRAEELTLDATLTARRAQLHLLRAHTRSLSRAKAPTSDVVASGSVDRPAEGPPMVSGRLRLDQAWLIDRPDRLLRVDGELQVTGPLDAVTVGGAVTVVEGRFVVPESFFLDSTSLGLDPDVVVLRSAGAREADPEPAPDLLGGLTARVRVDLDRHLDVSATLPTEDLGGALTAALSELRMDATLDDVDGLEVVYGPEGISVVGVVEPARGAAVVLGRNFRIDGGRVSFTGADYADPFLDVAATHKNSSYGDVSASITGLASAPVITLTNPLYPSADDAIAILLFGAPVSELGGADASQAGVLLTLAVQTFASEQVQETGELTRLDLFELSSEGVRGGKRIGDRVLMIVGANFGDPNEVNEVELTVEVQLPKRWYLEVTTGTSAITDISAVWRRRF